MSETPQTIQPLDINAAPSPTAKTPKSLGERLFDLTTYGGITWIGNELLSVSTWRWIEKTGSLANRAYEGMASTLEKIGGSKNWGRKPLRIIALCTGGNLLIPAVKLFEDNKGKLVRYADEKLEGDRAQNDPALIRAHEAMDNAPKQTWTSLGKGRAVVMTLAVGLDYLCGDDKSPTYRMLKNTPLSKYSTMDRAGVTLARDFMRFPLFSWLERDPSKRAAIRAARSAPNPAGEALAKINPATEGKLAAALGGTFGFVLVLSGILTAIFYSTSKFFAARQEIKAKQREANPNQRSGLFTAETEISAGAPETTTSPTHDPSVSLARDDQVDAKPHARVSHVQHQHVAMPRDHAVSAPA